LLGVCVGLTVLLGGWAFGIANLRTVLPGYPVMVPNTALGLFLCGAAIYLNRPGKTSQARHVLAQLCAATAALLGAATLLEFFLGMSPGPLDRLLFPVSVALLASGGMAARSAATFLLLGAGLLLSHTRRSFALGQYLVVIAGGLTLFAVIGHLFGIQSFFRLVFRTGNAPIAVHTSLTLAILCAGALLSRPDWGL